jgi:DNA-binding NarL/FixJ family response regulator
LLIESSPNAKVTAEAANYTQALAALDQRFDVIILDQEYGGDCSIDLIPNLLSSAKGARILILTGEWDPAAHYRAVGLGALGLVFKTDSPEVLVKAIEKVHTGEVWLESVTMARLIREMWQGRGETDKPDLKRDKLTDLTEREREVTALIGERLQNKQIADRLFLCEATVRHHLTSIYSKLNIKNRFELALYAYRQGLAKQPF